MKPLHTLALTCVFCFIFLIYALYYNYKKQEIDSKNANKNVEKLEKRQDSIKLDSKEREKNDKILLDSIMQKYKDKKPKIWAENPQGSINTAADLGQDSKDYKTQDSNILQDFKNLDSKDSNTLKDSKKQASNVLQNSNTKNLALESKFLPQDSINNHNPTQNLDSKNHNNLSQKVIYLTLDACGGEYDSKLIDFLIQNNIKATLFINARWIKKHEQDFLKLTQNPLFSLQNHGTSHKPLSVNGARIYGIQGTKNIQEVFDEINENDKIMTRLSGKKPRYFRSGTAFYDDVAMDIAHDMGYKIAGFNVVGDGGATYSLQKILKIGSKVQNGDILIYHFNKPQSSTRVGLEQLIDSWKKEGFTFGLLE